MKLVTAAAYLDMDRSTFRHIYPILVAKFGLPDPAGVCGPKFSRAELDKAFARVARTGADLTLSKNTKTVKVNGLAVAVA